MRSLLVILFASSILLSAGQTLEQRLLDAGMNNVVCWREGDRSFAAFEPAAWKLPRQGINRALEVVGDSSVTLIVLRNNVPQISISKEGVGYDIDATVPTKGRAASTIGRVDIVFYPELLYRNIMLNKFYEVVVNLSPAIEVSPWRGGLITAQLILPIVNQYGEQYAKIRPGFVTLSQQFRLGRFMGQATVGNFASSNRWGADLRGALPLDNQGRFTLRAEYALTARSYFRGFEWEGDPPASSVWNVAGTYYNQRYNTILTLSGGMYTGGDLGVRADLARHFKYCTIGFYGISSQKSSLNGGFYFAVALPPYHYKRSAVRITTSDYFSLNYNARAEAYYGRELRVSPRDNVAADNYNPMFINSQKR